MLDQNPLDKDGSHEDGSDEDQSDEEQSFGHLSEDDLSQNGDDDRLEHNDFEGLQHGNEGVEPQPFHAPIYDPDMKICDEHGCGEPTFFQTPRARKCRFHLENPPPQTRWQDLDHAATADPDSHSRCKGPRPLRAPGKTY
ncbi:hypothetical protein QR685DRAFT_541557 [Neurospora intermedia]|uniref:Uncharacterized protein n=1 Tax=Neurospora intermedia TaxID=5142 RepID=A0ABR3DKJ5_NEUIN